MALPMDRAAALELLKTHTHTQSLIHHAISVEAAMRHFAEFYGEDVEYWGMVGLLHDLDYEEHPEEHCQYTPGYLREAGFDEDFIRAVLSHGYGLCTDVKPEKQMEKVIYTVGRTHRVHHRGGSDASQQEPARPGSEVGEEKVQG